MIYLLDIHYLLEGKIKQTKINALMLISIITAIAVAQTLNPTPIACAIVLVFFNPQRLNSRHPYP
jgi:hypothetical protein